MQQTRTNSPGDCAICGVPTLRVRHEFDAASHTLGRCPTCDLQLWFPLNHPTASYYEHEGHPIYSQGHAGQHRLDERHRHLFSRLGPLTGKRVLDVGCGSGTLLAELDRQGAVAYGIDIDSKAVEAARRAGARNVDCVSIPDFVGKPPDIGGFDFILLMDVLEHLTDPRQALQGLASLLAPGGKIVGTVPNRDRLLAAWINTDLPPHHFLRFDESSLRAVLLACKLRPNASEIFEYGYSDRVLMNWVLKSVRSRRSSQSTRAKVEGSEGRRSVGRLVTCVRWFTRPIAVVVERTTHRGFKIYFEAERYEERTVDA